nr:copia protein [Tanacetum cinerariifolium]
MKVKKSLNVTFDESPPPTKLSSLVDDDVGAFLNDFINEEAYVAQPPGFIDFQKPNYVYKLKKALYGLKQAPKAWYDRLNVFLTKHKYSIGMVDTTLFTKKSKSHLIIVQIYVENIIFGSTSQNSYDDFAKIMPDEFEMSMMGELNIFLGLQIRQIEDIIFFNQSKYVKEMLKKFGLEDSKPTKTPMLKEIKLTMDDEANSVDNSKYQGIIGSLLYLTKESINSGFARFNTIVTSLKYLDEGFSSKNYVTKFLMALHSKWRAKVMAIEESKDLSSLALDEIIDNLKVHEVVMEKNSKIYKGKKNIIKSIALKAKKESSDDETSTSGGDDEEYAMAVRNFKSSLEETINLLGNQEKKRSHSDKWMRRKERVTRNVLDAVIQIISLAIVQNHLTTKIKRPSLEILRVIAKMTSKTKLTMKLVSWLNHQTSANSLREMLNNQKLPSCKIGLGFDSGKASTSRTKTMSFVGSSAEKAIDRATINVHGSILPGSVCLRTCLEPDEWNKDSGCFKHMTGNKSLFSTYKAYDGGESLVLGKSPLSEGGDSVEDE